MVLEVGTARALGKELPSQGEASIHTCKRHGGRRTQTWAASNVTAPLSCICSKHPEMDKV